MMDQQESFFSTVKSNRKNTSLLDGSHNRRVLRHNATAIQVGILNNEHKWLPI